MGAADIAARLRESRAAHLAPGVGALLLGPRGTVVAVAGRASAAGARAVDLGAPWHLGSCTKAMTATLLARLAEAGILSIDATLGAIWPTMPMHPGYRDVTLGALARHHGGVPRDPPVTSFAALRRSGAPVTAQRMLLVRQTLRNPPRPDAGYSNLGYILLGAAIETALGRSWEAALAAEVFAPLGIGGHGFGAPPLPMTGHRRQIGRASCRER